jgi:hypothetical protein
LIEVIGTLTSGWLYQLWGYFHLPSRYYHQPLVHVPALPPALDAAPECAPCAFACNFAYQFDYLVVDVHSTDFVRVFVNAAPVFRHISRSTIVAFYNAPAGFSQTKEIAFSFFFSALFTSLHNHNQRR